jgi:hypothetical protein
LIQTFGKNTPISGRKGKYQNLFGKTLAFFAFYLYNRHVFPLNVRFFTADFFQGGAADEGIERSHYAGWHRHRE